MLNAIEHPRYGFGTRLLDAKQDIHNPSGNNVTLSQGIEYGLTICEAALAELSFADSGQLGLRSRLQGVKLR
jgi:hypothetical protein